MTAMGMMMIIMMMVILFRVRIPVRMMMMMVIMLIMAMVLKTMLMIMTMTTIMTLIMTLKMMIMMTMMKVFTYNCDVKFTGILLVDQIRCSIVDSCYSYEEHGTWLVGGVKRYHFEVVRGIGLGPGDHHRGDSYPHPTSDIPWTTHNDWFLVVFRH